MFEPLYFDEVTLHSNFSKEFLDIQAAYKSVDSVQNSGPDSLVG